MTRTDVVVVARGWARSLRRYAVRRHAFKAGESAHDSSYFFRQLTTPRRCDAILTRYDQCADLAEKWNAARDDAQLSKFSPKDIESFITAQKREMGIPVQTPVDMSWCI
jgi:hypothetical protein